MSYTDKSVSPNEQYTYTHFQPYYCHRLFPCFDQPDLKATLELNVIVPEKWIAVGNEAVSYQQVTFDKASYKSKVPIMAQQSILDNYLQGKNGAFFVFGRTKRLPSYLFCLVAGQYYSVSLPAQERYNVYYELFRIFRWQYTAFPHINQPLIITLLLFSKQSNSPCNFTSPSSKYPINLINMRQLFATSLPPELCKTLESLLSTIHIFTLRQCLLKRWCAWLSL